MKDLEVGDAVERGGGAMDETRKERMARAFPHGPDEPCTCDGCHDGRTGCTGHVIGCTCDIEWDWDS